MWWVLCIPCRYVDLDGHHYASRDPSREQPQPQWYYMSLGTDFILNCPLNYGRAEEPRLVTDGRTETCGLWMKWRTNVNNGFVDVMDSANQMESHICHAIAAQRNQWTTKRFFRPLLLLFACLLEIPPPWRSLLLIIVPSSSSCSKWGIEEEHKSVIASVASIFLLLFSSSSSFFFLHSQHVVNWSEFWLWDSPTRFGIPQISGVEICSSSRRTERRNTKDNFTFQDYW